MMAAMADDRELGLFDATMLVMGGIVGVGIFFTPGTVAALLPSGPAFLGAWLAGGLVALCGALTFAELGANLPAAGGWFVYLRRAFGPLVAFLFAWTILGVVTTGAIAVIASFCATQVGALVPWVGAEGSLSHLLVAASIIVGLTGVALFGIRMGAALQSAVMVAKIAAILALAAAGLAVGLGGAEQLKPLPAAGPPPGGWAAGLAAASLPVFFSFGGWQNLCYAADRVKDPARLLPRAIVLGVAAAVVIYLLVNGGFLAVHGVGGLAQRGDFAADLAAQVLGSPGRRALQAAMAVSALGVCTVTILLAPGIYVAMAREGLFFASWGRLVGARRVPVAGLLSQGALALAYLLWSQEELLFGPRVERGMDFEVLTSSVVFAEWIFHALVAAALIRLRSAVDGFRPLGSSPALRYAPHGYLLAASGVVFGNLLTSSGLQTLVGLVAVGLGVIAYLLWQAFNAGKRAAS
jgi:APA family basic amino acid/polyamine antiporter